jgi:inner membrane protein involved in colicin E2 resistance
MWIVKQINEREIMNEQLASKIRSQLSGKVKVIRPLVAVQSLIHPSTKIYY